MSRFFFLLFDPFTSNYSSSFCCLHLIKQKTPRQNTRSSANDRKSIKYIALELLKHDDVLVLDAVHTS